MNSNKCIAFDDASISDLNSAFDGGTLTSERLVRLSLARVGAFDRQGPKLRAVITLNPAAVETARALDVERKASGPRSRLHGIPVVLKDNHDTADLPTTAGSVFLEGSIPKEDAFVVGKLRTAGAIVLAKVTLGEFNTGTFNSISGQLLNPHDLARYPGDSSGGTGVAIAAGYAPFGMGTDTGGSVRLPAAMTGVVGLKTTYGLLGRTGILPSALSLDTTGALARNVQDVAISLGLMTGVDPRDDATKQSVGRATTDYSATLNADALGGARVGIVRNSMGADPQFDWVVEAALDTMGKAGATVIEVRYPQWLLDVKDEFYEVIKLQEQPNHVAAYLATLAPAYPKNYRELVDRAFAFNAPREDGAAPNPLRWAAWRRYLQEGGKLDDPNYVAIRDHGLPLIRSSVQGMFDANRLDTLVYPTYPKRPHLVKDPWPDEGFAASLTYVANFTGFPELCVPAGFTSWGFPVGLSFLGTAFSEAKLLSIGYAFEQVSRARRRPVHTPALKDSFIEIPATK
ncbi:glutamyl-tRNA amidotransferase [Bradyrhizobium sp. 139]|uniref:amidase family protein n=1 Tax=Bradyrhizobium sp. 139 TaxID=2782616 RepID=UPI001FF81ED9|nr:amidase family protein [Bradyrhizobium sp. 139]MCK1741344.1 glutamyl-tRNA amidotransferase [Bradyrhizobium sp. 139]